MEEDFEQKKNVRYMDLVEEWHRKSSRAGCLPVEVMGRTLRGSLSLRFWLKRADPRDNEVRFDQLKLGHLSEVVLKDPKHPWNPEYITADLVK